MKPPTRASERRGTAADTGDLTRREILAMAASAAVMAAPAAASSAVPKGEMTIALHVSVAPTWFDPAETQALITPFMVLYALHDAMAKPMPDKLYSPCLAESWSVSKDYLSYEFTLREGCKFHNGDTVTSEDVKFSFERYRGAAVKLLKQNNTGCGL